MTKQIKLRHRRILLVFHQQRSFEATLALALAVRHEEQTSWLVETNTNRRNKASR